MHTDDPLMTMSASSPLQRRRLSNSLKGSLDYAPFLTLPPPRTSSSPSQQRRLSNSLNGSLDYAPFPSLLIPLTEAAQ